MNLSEQKQSRRGASLLSYGLIVGLVSVVALAAVTSTGSNVVSLFDEVGGSLTDVTQAGADATPEATPLPPCTPGSQSFSFTATDDSVTIPPGCTTVTITAVGGMGGDGLYNSTDNGGPGRGGSLTVTFTGSSSLGELRVRVAEGGYGGCRSNVPACLTDAGGRLGFGGRSGGAGVTGGMSGTNSAGHRGGGGGGGYSSVERLSDGELLVVAGGGGGGAAEVEGGRGGGGGLPAGNAGANNGGGAGTQFAGGAGGSGTNLFTGDPGSFLLGGNSASTGTSTNCVGGAGGGGYYGGGGGSSINGSCSSGGGGGGSSYFWTGGGGTTGTLDSNTTGGNGSLSEGNGDKGNDGSIDISWSD